MLGRSIRYRDQYHKQGPDGQLYIDEDKRSETYGERIFEVTKNRFGCSGRAWRRKSIPPRAAASSST